MPRRLPERRDNGAGPGEAGEPVLGDVLDFMRLIWGVSHGLQSASKRMEAAYGITGPQRLVVRILGRCPDASAGELAKTLHLDPSTLTGVLRRLEDRGIIERRPVAGDRRRVHLRLTPAGRGVDRKHQGTVENAVRQALADIDPSKVQAASELLEALDRALENARVPPPRRRRSKAKA
jgi:DNA-binding MarR family transcriptional regulator